MNHIRERIDNATERGKFVKEHIAFRDDKTIDHILCRLCGVIIYGWADVEAKTETKLDGQKVVAIRQQPMKFDNYAQLQFELNDDSIYEPPACASCAENAKFNADDFEELMGIELYAWELTLKRAGRTDEHIRRLLKPMEDREIVKHLGMKQER